MNYRLSSVGKINIIVIDEASTLEIGDSNNINTTTYILAVQRERAIFYDNEFKFNDYEIFSIPISPPLITENIYQNHFHKYPIINVGEINIITLSSDSIVHIGSSNNLITESRIKNIRHLFQEKPAIL